jgi:hypothetical protein
MGSRPYRTKGGRTMPCSIFPSKNSRPGLESAIFLFRDSHGGTEGALKQRQSSAVWEQAREWRKSSRIEKNGRGGSPSGPKTQARRRRLPQTKSSRRAAGTQRRGLLKHPEFRQRELLEQHHQHLARVLVLKSCRAPRSGSRNGFRPQWIARWQCWRDQGSGGWCSRQCPGDFPKAFLKAFER